MVAHVCDVGDRTPARSSWNSRTVRGWGRRNTKPSRSACRTFPRRSFRSRRELRARESDRSWFRKKKLKFFSAYTRKIFLKTIFISPCKPFEEWSDRQRKPTSRTPVPSPSFTSARRPRGSPRGWPGECETRISIESSIDERRGVIFVLYQFVSDNCGGPEVDKNQQNTCALKTF